MVSLRICITPKNRLHYIIRKGHYSGFSAWKKPRNFEFATGFLCQAAQKWVKESIVISGPTGYNSA
jgi:hypothetical protein